MNHPREPELGAHLARHARRLHRIACGLGRQRDAEDLVQTLYARWWRRMKEEPSFSPPDSHVELFVCVRRAALDAIAKEAREDRRVGGAGSHGATEPSPEETLDASAKLAWILATLPAGYAEVLLASLASGRAQDADVARELGLSPATYTMRLFKARRAAEELADLFERLPLEEASLAASQRFRGARVGGERDLEASTEPPASERSGVRAARRRKAAS